MSHLLSPTFDPIAMYTMSVEIDCPIEEVWAVLTDIASYPKWNPHLRSAVMVNASHKPTPDPAVREGILAVGMLTEPSMDPSKKPTVHYETVTLVDHAAHRFTYGGARHPILFRAEHSHVLSTTPSGKTRYEARHMWGGLTGYLVKSMMGEGLEKCGWAMAEALKKRAESKKH